MCIGSCVGGWCRWLRLGPSSREAGGAGKIEFQDSPATDRMKVEGRALSKLGASPQ